MREVFADTFFYLALVSRDDAFHQRAVRAAADLRGRVITTAWVLTEVADALCSPAQRPIFLSLMDHLRGDEKVTIVSPTLEWFDRGLELYAERPDKDWSLTDCISFLVMEHHGLTEALTADHHFEQAGFKALLK